MVVSVMTIDRQVYGPTATNGSGIATFNINCSVADVIYRIQARAYAVIASAGHLATAGSWCCEYVVTNKNGSLATVSAVSSSANPDNFSGLVAARVEAADALFSLTTGTWAPSGTNAVLTVTVQNAGGGPQSGVSVLVVADIEYCGAT